MKIELESPFKELYRYGYLVVNPENRRNVILYNSNTDRTTISYARYLVSVETGSILESRYEVDHIDNDKTNDSLDNLQILTVEENRQKRIDNNTTAVYLLKCAECQKIFYKEARLFTSRSKFCSRQCTNESLKSKNKNKVYSQIIIKDRHNILSHTLE